VVERGELVLDPNELLSVISTSFSEGSAQSAVTAVKTAVTQGLTAVDKSVRIEWTNYFNHDFAPDMVMSWSDSSTDPRDVFLRLSTDAADIRDDLQYLGSEHPMIFGLGVLSEQLPAEVREMGDAHNWLVIDPGGLAPLADESKRMKSLLGAAVLKGGRSVVNQSVGSTLVATVDEGFDGALGIEVEPTARAIEIVDQVLNPEQGGRLARFFEALWIGRGGSPTSFPSTSIELSGLLTDESLKFLVSWEETIDDVAFWKRIARRTGLDQLGRLESVPPTVNLQRLMEILASIVPTQRLRVDAGQARLGDSQELRWDIHDGLVNLVGSNFRAAFAERSDVLEPSGDPKPGITVEELATRAGSVPIVTIELGNGVESVLWRSETNSDVKASDSLASTVHELGYGTRVSSVVAAASRALECDLTRGFSSTGNRGKVPLVDFLECALPILWPLVDADAVELAQLLDIAREVWAAPSLFDLLEPE
jgi:hypothetical protein